jgi:hypothetical protein
LPTKKTASGSRTRILLKTNRKRKADLSRSLVGLGLYEALHAVAFFPDTAPLEQGDALKALEHIALLLIAGTADSKTGMLGHNEFGKTEENRGTTAGWQAFLQKIHLIGLKAAPVGELG